MSRSILVTGLATDACSQGRKTFQSPRWPYARTVLSYKSSSILLSTLQIQTLATRTSVRAHALKVDLMLTASSGRIPCSRKELNYERQHQKAPRSTDVAPFTNATGYLGSLRKNPIARGTNAMIQNAAGGPPIMSVGMGINKFSGDAVPLPANDPGKRRKGFIAHEDATQIMRSAHQNMAANPGQAAQIHSAMQRAINSSTTKLTGAQVHDQMLTQAHKQSLKDRKAAERRRSRTAAAAAGQPVLSIHDREEDLIGSRVRLQGCNMGQACAQHQRWAEHYTPLFLFYNHCFQGPRDRLTKR